MKKINYKTAGILYLVAAAGLFALATLKYIGEDSTAIIFLSVGGTMVGLGSSVLRKAKKNQDNHPEK